MEVLSCRVKTFFKADVRRGECLSVYLSHLAVEATMNEIESTRNRL